MKITDEQLIEEIKSNKGVDANLFKKLAKKYGSTAGSIKTRYYKLKKEGKLKMLDIDPELEKEGEQKLYDILNEGEKKTARVEKETTRVAAKVVINGTLNKTTPAENLKKASEAIANVVKKSFPQPKIEERPLLTVTELRSDKNFFVLDGDSVKIYDETEHYITVKAQDLKTFAMANMELNKRFEGMQL